MGTPIISSNRLLELDSLRGLASLGVMICHFTTGYTLFFPGLMVPVFKFPQGQYGVGLFFMISGFVILMTLEKTERPMDFIVSRFSRLYPCYWTAILFTFLIVRIFPANSSRLEVSFKHALINLTMLQDWFKVPPVDGVYWTLTVELSFYLLLFIIYLGRKLKYIEEIGLAFLGIMAIYNRFIWHNDISIPMVIVKSKLLMFWNFFYAGILFYNLKTKGNAWHRHAALFLCLIVQYMVQDMIPEAPNLTLYAIFFYFVFYLFIYNRLSFLVQKPLIFLGTISYSLYLVHSYIGFIIINNLYAKDVNPWLCFILPSICAFIIASLITFCVERPAMAYLRQFYKNWKMIHAKSISS